MMATFFLASYRYPSLKDKKEAVKRWALLISFMALPLSLIVWGVFFSGT
jgi:hypothetical protein